MKVFSILFESKLNPGRISLFTSACENSEEALAQGEKSCIDNFGDLLWSPRLANNITINAIPLVENKDKTKDITASYDKNWVMGKIIETKDINLFNAMRGYMSENEVRLVQEKLNS